ncbi:MAG: SPOR domain-containing protein [Bacteroidota bacterium]
MNRMYLVSIVILLNLALSSAHGQRRPDIQRYLDMIQRGQADQVKAELPNLVARHQRHPGVIYLQGMLTSDGAEAAKVFQSVVDNYPESEWADDALYKVYQFYYSLGLYRTAEGKLAELRRKYPQSEYVTGKKPPTVAATPSPQPAVKATPPDRQPPKPAVRPKTVRTGSAYSVQIGAFRKMENASTLRSFFQREGYDVEVRNKVRNGQSLHAVWIGSFGSLEEARTFSQNLQARYKIDSFVVAR